MSSVYLKENLTFDQARMVTESANDGKDLFLKGICIQGGVKNHNQRIYPVDQIATAVTSLNEQITEGNSVLGEVDHPDDLNLEIWSVLQERSTLPSIVISLSSQITISFLSFSLPANDITSWLIPSIRHPSPAMT